MLPLDKMYRGKFLQKRQKVQDILETRHYVADEFFNKYSSIQNEILQ